MKRILIQAAMMALVATLFFPSLAWTAEIWQIGKDDNSSGEFLEYGIFLGRHPNGTEFIIGKSDSKEHWPSTQPGPADVWAGSRSHTTTVLFDMNEIRMDVAYEFVLDGAAHYGQPPLFVLELNGAKQELQTEPNCESDVAINTGKAQTFNYTCTFPADAFKKGQNRLTITSAKGSWFVYDRVALYARTGQIDALLIWGPRGISKKTVNGIENTEGGPKPFSREEFTRKIKFDYQGELLKQDLGMEIIAKSKSTTVHHHTSINPRQNAYGGEREISFGKLEDALNAIDIRIELKDDGQTVCVSETTLPPERPWEVHLIHQTHLDIGYTHTQQEVLDRQVQSLRDAIQYIEETKDYPEEARFKWHPEGMWAVDEFFRVATAEEKAAFIRAAQNRDIHLDILYAQAMTGMYNEEELFELMANAVRFGKEHNVTIDSAMQTDVPGYTWGLVPALVQNGVKYLNIGPNHIHRVGRLYYWGDKPFYWTSPSGKEKILCWMLGTGYYQFHAKPRDHELQEQEIFRLIDRYESLGKDFPYDILMVRYGLEGDNGRPNRKISDAVKAWNEKYVYPKLILARNSDTMAEFERRYGDTLPVIHGDYTPYWEDGAASTSEATALNRQAHEKILQAQTLWTLLKPGEFPFDRFDTAWTDMIMYDEHTWGAHNSITEPDSDFVRSQDDYKQAYARRAIAASTALLEDALKDRKSEGAGTIEVFNTASWERENWVTIPVDAKWNSALDPNGKPVPSQKLADGTLAFKASVPALGSAIFTLSELENQAPAPKMNVTMSGTNPVMEISDIPPGMQGLTSVFVVNCNSDSIALWNVKGIGNTVNQDDGEGNRGLNDFLHIIGRHPEENRDRGFQSLERFEQDRGPYIFTSVFKSTAPNCEKLTRIYRQFLTEDYLEITNILEKKMERRQEGMYFGFPFALDGGKWNIDIPWVTFEVEKDQLPGANRNYYPIQRFCNFGNDMANIDWLSLDAPLVQFAPIKTVENHLNMDTEWRDHIAPGGTIYSWICNNHWETNYKAGQDGTLTFRYVIRPNRGPFDRVNSQKFARDMFQPLIAVPVKKETKPLGNPTGGMLSDSPVIVTSTKPLRLGGKGLIVRLHNTSNAPANVSGFSRSQAKLSLAGPNEDVIGPVEDVIEFAPFEIKTLRIE